MPSRPKTATAGTSKPTRAASSSPTRMARRGRGTRGHAAASPRPPTSTTSASWSTRSSRWKPTRRSTRAACTRRGCRMERCSRTASRARPTCSPRSHPSQGRSWSICNAAKPTSVLHIHGVADENVPYAGGPGKAETVTGAPRVDGPSVQADIARWRSIDACAAPTSQVEGRVHVDLDVPGRPHGRADLDRRSGSSMAGLEAEPRRASARGGSSFHRHRRDRRHLGVLIAHSR